MKRALLLIFLLAISVGKVLAAVPVLNFEISSSSNIINGSTFDVKVSLDSINDDLNGYNVEFLYQPRYLTAIQLDTSHSIIDQWQGEPGIFAGEEENLVRLKGSSSNSFRGQGGELISIRFLPVQEGITEIRLHNALFLLANGSGEQVPPFSNPLTITITAPSGPGNTGQGQTSIGQSPTQSSGSSGSSYTETISPEIELSSFVTDPSEPSKKVLSLSVSSKISSIKNIEARSRTLLTWSDWQPVKSPYSFSKSAWAVEVRASDEQDRISQKVVYDWSPFSRYPLVFFPIAVVFLITGLGYIYRKLRAKPKFENI